MGLYLAVCPVRAGRCRCPPVCDNAQTMRVDLSTMFTLFCSIALQDPILFHPYNHADTSI